MEPELLFTGLGIFILVSFFCSGSETAFFSLTSFKIEDLVKKYPTRGKLIKKIVSAPQKLLITILICNIFANIMATKVAKALFKHYLGGNEALVLVLTPLTMTLIILIFGEVTPKSLAIKFAPAITLVIAPIYIFLIKLFTPLIFVLQKVVRLLVAINSLLFFRNVEESDEYMADELIEIVKESKSQGIVNDTEGYIIQNVIEFSGIDVWKLMKQRNEIFSFPLETEMEEVFARIKEKRYSRVPIWEGTEENIIGILHAKELLKLECPGKNLASNAAIFKKPVYVPESMKAEELLKTFQTTNNHMALVIDEYGGISGLITLEDILEGIIGDVVDKDDIVPLYHKYNPFMIEVEARMDIAEFNQVFGANLRCEEAISVGGYLLEKLKRLPETGEIFSFDNLQFKVSGALPNRIEKLLITRQRKIKKKKSGFFKMEGTVER